MKGKNIEEVDTLVVKKEIVLLDGGGKKRAVMGVDEDGSATLQFFDNREKSCAGPSFLGHGIEVKLSAQGGSDEER